MKIDLNTCKPGQKLRLRRGDIVEYRSRNLGLGPCSGSPAYPHHAGSQSHGDLSFTSGGSYNFASPNHPLDVVEIIPLETPPVDLNTCKPGQKLRLRCGTLALYKRAHAASLRYPHVVQPEDDIERIYTSTGSYCIDRQNNPLDVVEIFPLVSTSNYASYMNLENEIAEAKKAYVALGERIQNLETAQKQAADIPWKPKPGKFYISGRFGRPETPDRFCVREPEDLGHRSDSLRAGIALTGACFQTREAATIAAAKLSFLLRLFNLAAELNGGSLSDGAGFVLYNVATSKWCAFDRAVNDPYSIGMRVFVDLATAAKAAAIMNRDGWKPV